MIRTPPTMAAIPRGNDSDFKNANPPIKAGIAAKMAIQCVCTFFPHDRQLTVRPGPSADLLQRLIAARLQ
jgi:hypothetical protein